MLQMDTNDLVVGIDLGTSNSALAYFPIETSDRNNQEVKGTDANHGSGKFGDEQSGEPVLLQITQLTGPEQIDTTTVLPSSIYIIPPQELDSFKNSPLPWGSKEYQSPFVVGSYARKRASEVPDQVVTSPKSWLSTDQVDRMEAILPWEAGQTSGDASDTANDTAEQASRNQSAKISPVTASTLILEHLKNAFNNIVAARSDQNDELQAGVCVVTVPASFDEVARTLTHDAARAAGLGEVVLLEEPLAALYSWLDSNAGRWQERIKPGDIILVCDIGGGTSDFSLVSVSESSGDLQFDRISVGRHLLLGGDNMDLTLAYHLRAHLENDGDELDQWQLNGLVAACRGAKEQILSDDSVDQVPISISSRGSSLFASSRSTYLERQLVEDALIAGFLPLTDLGDHPRNTSTMGIAEFGLRYESDPAISKHLAQFLCRSFNELAGDERLAPIAAEQRRRFESSEAQSAVMPTAILFNGGVFKAEKLRQRIVQCLGSWFETPIANLNESIDESSVDATLDVAVARGAAFYGRMKKSGKGIRIRSGVTRSYYIGVESAAPAVPGFKAPVRGLCLLPQGTEEGTEIIYSDKKFVLTTGEPVEFRFFSSTERGSDQVGTMVPNAERELVETASLHATLPKQSDLDNSVPVFLDVRVTEVGTLQLSLKHVISDHNWKLEFNIRPSSDA